MKTQPPTKEQLRIAHECGFRLHHENVRLCRRLVPLASDASPVFWTSQVMPNLDLSPEEVKPAAALPRFDYSNSGFIVDNTKPAGQGRLGRLKDVPTWRLYGEFICQELNESPDNASAIIESWALHLEPAKEKI